MSVLIFQRILHCSKIGRRPAKENTSSIQKHFASAATISAKTVMKEISVRSYLD
uniref:Uncharacterized protein n=1 Tax=Lepeophtheirus salmonis TaxID=72036 RepID=A0A0K2V216_LEPSM